MACIDMTGVRGTSGKNGAPGHGFGQSGQNAGLAKPGGDGGVAYLRLARVPEHPQRLQVTGTVHG